MCRAAGETRQSPGGQEARAVASRQLPEQAGCLGGCMDTPVGAAGALVPASG